MKITKEIKKLIGDLLLQGKSIKEIMDLTGCNYDVVYRMSNVDIIRVRNRDYQRRLKMNKPAEKVVVPSGYVDTARELPPTNPPGPITYIHADRECVESGLIAQYGRKLSPITCTLAERKPVMSFSNQDRLA